MTRLGSTPWKFQGITGRRKGTAMYCLQCQTWHPTPRGIGESGCPRESQESGPRSPCYIPRERLGTQAKKVRIPFRMEGVTS